MNAISSGTLGILCDFGPLIGSFLDERNRVVFTQHVSQAVRNLSLAMEAIEYVRSVNIFSPNYANRGDHLKGLRPGTERYATALSQRKEELVRTWTQIRSGDFENKLEQRAAASLKTRLGNCVDISCIAYRYIKETFPSLCPILYAIERKNKGTYDDDGHVFIMIGEGDQAAICDGWALKAYPYTLIRNRLQHFDGADPHGIPSLTLFDPNIHHIKPILA